MKGPRYVLKRAVGTVNRHVSEGRGMHAYVPTLVLLCPPRLTSCLSLAYLGCAEGTKVLTSGHISETHPAPHPSDSTNSKTGDPA